MFSSLFSRYTEEKTTIVQNNTMSISFPTNHTCEIKSIVTNEPYFSGKVKHLIGTLLHSTDKSRDFLRNICDINPDNYDRIYKIDNNWAGAYLLLYQNKYRYVICGSGVAITSDITGYL